MNKEQSQIMMESYRQYSERCARKLFKSNTYQEFINKCKTDPEFSKTWGLKIEERELSLEERVDYKKKRDGIARTFAPYTHQMLDGSNIPTKLITITYNKKTIESYE